MIDWRVFGQVSKAGQLHGLEDGYVLYFLSDGHDGIMACRIDSCGVAEGADISRPYPSLSNVPPKQFSRCAGDRHAPNAERLNQP